MSSVIVAGFAERVGAYYANELRAFFGDDIDISYISIKSDDLSVIKEYDMVLITSYTIIGKIIAHTSEDTKILKISKNLDIRGAKLIDDLDYGMEALVVNVGPKTVSESIYLIYSYGRTDLELHPYYPGIENYKEVDTILTQGELEITPQYGADVIDIYNTTIDVKTFLELIDFFKLDKARYLNKLVERQSFRSTKGDGVSLVISERSMFDNIINVLFENLNEGVLIYDHMGCITTISSSVQKFLRKNTSSLLGKEVHRVFDLEKEVLFGENTVESIIKLGNTPYICNIIPRMVFGKNQYGLVIIKKYSDAEMKMHMHKRELLEKGHRAKYGIEDIVGTSEQMAKLKEYALRISKSESTVLITGESGTGKELFAHAIHNNSRRNKEQFIAINCSAIPENLLESELFGYEDGAFTGAKKGGKQGVFEYANGGTLFLDEIGEMPIHLQNRLLRVLQEQEIMRIGGSSIIKIDVRIIAATNIRLKEQVKAGKFRKDLFYRLNILPLKLPPLRERGRDVLEIFHQMMLKKNEVVDLSEAVQEHFLMYEWDGNIRELANCGEYLLNLGKRLINLEDLPETMMMLERSDDSTLLKETYKSLEDQKGEDQESEDYIKKNKQSFESVPSVMKDINKILLSILYENAKRGKKVGRKSISISLAEHDIFLGEQEVRDKLLDLSQDGYVVINRGRGGTQITEKGIHTLKLY